MEWAFYWVLKIVIKVAVKSCLNTWLPGSGNAVDLCEAGWYFYNKKIVDGVLAVAFVVRDVKPFNVEDAIKDAMKISSKEAVVQSAKDLAKSEAKKASRKVGQDLGKMLAMGTIKGGKDAAIETAKVVAQSASKEATRKVGQQVGKEIAKNVIPSAVEEVWYKGTEVTLKKLGQDALLSTISSGGHEIKKNILEDWLETGIKEMLKRKPVEMAFELTKEAAKKGAEKEFMYQSYKLFHKDLNAALLKGTVKTLNPGDLLSLLESLYTK